MADIPLDTHAPPGNNSFWANIDILNCVIGKDSYLLVDGRDGRTDQQASDRQTDIQASERNLVGIFSLITFFSYFLPSFCPSSLSTSSCLPPPPLHPRSTSSLALPFLLFPFLLSPFLFLPLLPSSSTASNSFLLPSPPLLPSPHHLLSPLLPLN